MGWDVSGGVRAGGVGGWDTGLVGSGFGGEEGGGGEVVDPDGAAGGISLCRRQFPPMTANRDRVFFARGLTKIYPGGKKVFENIWLSFYPDAKIGVVGVNGSGKSTLLKIMAGTYTGRSRLRSGLAPHWSLAHKTGTGQVLGSTSTAINDVGVMKAPDGCLYPVAVMIAQTRSNMQVTNGLMQNVARAIIDHHNEIHPKT